MTQGYSIQWDSSLPPFSGPGSELPEVGYAIEAMADGTNFGNPEALIEVVKSLLTDGSLAVLEGWDNRQAPIRLRLSAPTAIAGPALAEAEKALMLAVTARSKAPLVYVPTAQDAATCVFDVVAAKLERDVSDGWDLDELRREYRYYLLTLTCLPFARPEESVVVPALILPPVTPTVVTLDSCDSLTGWSYAIDETAGGFFAQSFAVVSSAVSITDAPVNSTYYTEYPGYTLTRTGALSMAGMPYLGIDVRQSHPSTYGLPTIKVDGLTKSPLGTASLSGGITRIYVASGDFTSLAVSVPRIVGGPSVSGQRWLQVSNVVRTDTVGDGTDSTLRQQSRTATVLGSAPTQAAIRLFDATPAALGTEILVHSSRNTAWQPALRESRFSSTTPTADSARVSGSRNLMDTPMVFRMAASLFTEGTYSLMALMNVTTAGTLNWSARMVSSSGATTIGSAITASGSIVAPVTSGYKVLNIAAISLPVVRAEADQLVELTLTGTANMTFDEGWLFGLDDGALTWIRDSGSTLQWVEIRSPELNAARPSVYGGTGAVGNGAVCIDFMCESFGAHRFEPGLMQVFTVTSTSLVSQSELEFYPRYHSHVEGSAA